MELFSQASPKLQSKTAEAAVWLDRLRGLAAEYIDRAEALYRGAKRGGEKFEWVVGQLHALLPEAIRPFLSRDTIGDLVQGVFDSVESYAIRQLERAADPDLQEEAADA